jgi:translation initiation factor IF-2
MNNGKLRIYELSRELNLDNKDILTFCEQLDIAVKSHSSTITEEEAQRIRSAAQDRVIPDTPENSPASPQHSSRTKKQEILEVKHQPRTYPASTSPVDSSFPPIASENLPETDSNETTSPTPDPSLTLNQPIKPILKKPASADTTLVAPGTASANAEASPSPSPDKRSPEAERKAAADKKPLMPPPARPSERPTTTAAPEPDREEDAPKPVRPVPKPVKGAVGTEDSSPKAPEAGEASPTGEQKLSKPSKPTKPSTIEKPSRNKPPGSEGAATTLNRPQKASDPQRPQSIVRIKAAGSEAAEDIDLDETPKEEGAPKKPEELLLLKPKPTRTDKLTKKPGKKRKDEEEEVVEIAEKAAKASKPKRWMKSLDEEDDDDLDGELGDDANAPVQVSLSIARPPKAQQTAKPTTAATSRAKKAAPSRDNSSKSHSSRDRGRNEQPAKVEKPQTLILRGTLTVRELAESLMIAETEIIKKLFMKGVAANVTQSLDPPTITLVAEEFGVTVETATVESEAGNGTEMIDVADLEFLQTRPPVVTIMGHVDHGKTTLLDTIRQAKVAQGEAGGITQHTGAYHVDVVYEGETKQIVFLDTPGHEAFTAMRARGARVTDIAVLVVAADDGVRPQTIEAISHAKAAKVPIVVAINKIDKEQAQPDRVKQELTEYGLLAEEWGGDTTMVPVSAMTGENLDTLLEMILLTAEMGELSANPDRTAKGTVIEAHVDKARGPVANLLIQNGTLRVGDILVAGAVLGKVRAMLDDRGNRVEAALPSFAVEVLGMSDVPAAGDEFEVYLSDKQARTLAQQRADEQRLTRLRSRMASRRVNLLSLSEDKREGRLKELNLILKGDVQGSVEAIVSSLNQLPQGEVQLRILLAGAGEITETDVDLAAASEAVILGFNTTLASGARQAADREGVDVREYDVIYRLLDDVQGAMEGLLDPELVEEPLGQAEVRAVFPVGRGTVAGCYIQSGQVVRNCKVRVQRKGQIIYEGGLDSLKRMREDAKEVNAGYECGIGLQSFHDWLEGDIISAYRLVTKRRTLAAR